MLGPAETLPRGTESTPTPTSAVLRHRLPHLLASSRSTHAALGRSSRRIHQRAPTRRPYCRIRRRWPQELRVQDAPGQSRMQGTRVHPQRSGSSVIELRTAETKRPGRSHAIRRRPEGTARSNATTVEETKRYKVVFDKRVVDPDTFLSYPYGYEKQVTLLDDDLSQAQAAQLDMDNVQLLMDLL